MRSLRRATRPFRSRSLQPRPKRFLRIGRRGGGQFLRPRRRNPDPEGNPWGPSLYDPLKDKKHSFKDDRHYKRVASRLRRNPSPRGITAPELPINVPIQFNVGADYARNPCSKECGCLHPCNCDSSLTSHRKLLRRNPSPGCVSCGLRFGIHRRGCPGMEFDYE